MYICVCIYACMYTYIYIYMYVCVYTHIYIYIYIYVCRLSLSLSLSLYIYIYIYIYIYYRGQGVPAGLSDGPAHPLVPGAAGEVQRQDAQGRKPFLYFFLCFSFYVVLFVIYANFNIDHTCIILYYCRVYHYMI